MKRLLLFFGVIIACTQLNAFTMSPLDLIGPFSNMVLLYLVFAATLAVKPERLLLLRLPVGAAQLIAAVIVFWIAALAVVFTSGRVSAAYPFKAMFIAIAPLMLALGWHAVDRAWALRCSRLIFLISGFWYVVYTLFVTSYDPEIGKFLVRDRFAALVNVSSNGISETFTLFGLPFALLWAIETRRSRWWVAILVALPLIHWSKTHLVFYVLAMVAGYLLVPIRPARLVVTGAIAALALMLLSALSVEGALEGSPTSIQRLFVAYFLFIDLDVFTVADVLNIIGEAGDFTRVDIYSSQIAWLSSSPILGYGDFASDDLLAGYDFHSTFLYYWVQFGLVALAAFVFVVLRLTQMVKDPVRRRIAVVTVVYFFAKASFSSVDPVHVMTMLALLVLMDHGLSRHTPIRNDTVTTGRRASCGRGRTSPLRTA